MRLDELVQGLEAVLADVDAGALPADYRPFALTSLQFVAELIARLEDGRFRDPGWVRALAIDADQRYLRAVRDRSARPGPWRVAFDVAERGGGRRMRNLLLGINAHIFYDLVVTLSQYLDAGKREQQWDDFMRLNDIIRTAVDVVQDGIEADERWIEIGDLAAGRVDEVLTWTTFKVTRARAFLDAEKLRAGNTTIGAVERNATLLAHALSFVPV